MGRGIVSSGVQAGLVAGAAMAAAAMAVSFLHGLGPLAPLRHVAAAVYGLEALSGGGEALAAGLAIHLAASSFFGVAFATMVSGRVPGRTAFWEGLVYGAAVWAVMTYAVLPFADPVMRARVDLMPGWFLIEHLVFGASLGLTPGLRRRTEARIQRRYERKRELVGV